MKAKAILAAVAVLAVSGAASGVVTVETVPVGNAGNIGELSGNGAGGYGIDRICGAVAYEYNIGKYEVTAGQYTAFLNAVATTDTYGLYNTDMAYGYNGYGCRILRSGSSGSYTYSVAADWANRPVNYVSWGDAARFANWLHNGQPSGSQDHTTTEDGAYLLDGAVAHWALLAVSRKADWTWSVPSEDEWYKAAYYDPTTGSYYEYATGNDGAPGFVNNDGNLSGIADLFMEGGADPGNYATSDNDAGTDGIGAPYYRTVVGEWENSASPYGTFDQSGNIHEWTDGIVYRIDSTNRNVRGGAFYTDGVFMRARFRDGDVSPRDEYYFIGFRVAQVPEPATLSLLALGGLAMIRRRRK